MNLLGIVLILALLFGFGLLYLISKGSTVSTRGLNKKFVQDKWQEIRVSLDQGNPHAFQSAVMEADKLFDYVLKAKVGVRKDQNMGERLRASQKMFGDYGIYQGVWSAHKVRNQMAHEASYELNSAIARGAIEQFEKGLRSLGAL